MNGEIWLDGNFVGIRVGKTKKYYNDIDEAFKELRRGFERECRRFLRELERR